ncbi:alfa-L-rhamnosidase [Agrilactobacillus composti DSM 18527 = JCM 14202]|nr:alfa-L-rhamnosidase [Agrilactobacillus composti DSM 18527 = JCM 14202]
MDAPLYIQLIFAEQPVEIGDVNKPYTGLLSQSWLQEEYIHLDTLPAKLELDRRYACRYVAIKVIDTSPKWQVQFSNPKFIAESSVTMTQVKPVKTGDLELDKIDAVSLKTLHDCMQDVFEDGPKRDRRLWLGDLRLQALANYASFDNQQLVKRCLYLFGGMPTVDGKISANVFTKPHDIPDNTFLYDYSLFFTSILFDYYQQYQDQETLIDLYPVAKTSIDLALTLVDSQGLLHLDKGWPVFIDWAQDFDKTTSAQAVLIYALKQFIELAQIKTDPDISKYQAQLTLLVSASQEQLFDKATRLFVSGPERQVNIASQCWMVLAGVLPDAGNYQLMTKTIAELFPVKGVATPYMYHHIDEALFKSGHKEEAVKLLKDYWGAMVHYGADTFWEAFKPEQPDFSPYNSLAINSFCHAWSCTPTYLIRKYLLGND